MTGTSRPIDTDDLPDVIKRYLEAHTARDASGATRAMTPQATVTDEGRTYRGAPEIEAWLNRATSEYTYTTTLLGAEQAGPDRYTAIQRLEGDFPGGRVDLRFRFTLDQGLIGDLVIAP
ncbi:nuclear transport factor 2 family protein [Streptomyces sp. NBC_01198]|uniref:nuclear transport factor 2 family protein n=1 Tax=Streptomyces sp. NBC_01198 TaxID=2903769 RepID=UPI002E10ED8E|nr:nuclear transport factor 2 family protein [Streptomyces sp. NBC_01198]